MRLNKLISNHLINSIILFSATTQIEATITKVTSVREGLAKYTDLGPTDLVVCDIDETLTRSTPTPKHLLSQPFDVQIQNRTSALLDTELPKILSDLQKKQVPVIALTHTRTGTFGVIPSMEEWRFNAVNQLGFSFSFDEKNHAFLLQQMPTPYPSFFKGIILSAHHDKGPVLLAFLKQMGNTPLRILFFDDLKRNIDSVHKTLGKITQVHCFHVREPKRAGKIS